MLLLGNPYCGYPSGSSVGPIAFSPDGARIFSGRTSIWIWDAMTGSRMFGPWHIGRLEGYGGLVSSVAVSFDSRRIISGSQDVTVHIWDIETGRIMDALEPHVPRMGMQGGAQFIVKVVVSPKGDRIIAQDGCHSVYVWSRGDT
ncbi:hypothetical protein PILCRDRAFT_70222 [Piloderma croceum F 1598]|uniref:Uncharacterized protein n=1 Tax=Piloderma croceum (strain F 1598) TaxID=765440 RepID=A0A0C3B936_PILCF|nr:hypothetical protein PILCRDRAFT_70222 [Piloderma croceum F 1598]